MFSPTEGVVHTHNARVCWLCEVWGVVPGALGLKTTHRELARRGWRFLEPHGRAVCIDCAHILKQNARQLYSL